MMIEEVVASELQAAQAAVLAGQAITKTLAMQLYERQPLESLCQAANAIRQHFCAQTFDLCTIINSKSGRCPENCRFCAQSIYSSAQIAVYPLRPVAEIVATAQRDWQLGARRFGIVTSGRRLTDQEVAQVCEAVQAIRREVPELAICVSLGLLSAEQYTELKASGVQRVHNNLETSRRFFPSICTSHSYDDKLKAIRAAQAAGLVVCSGGIIGLGETAEDRIDMALTLRELNIKSVPINLLNPIAGTALAHRTALPAEELRRVVAIYRFILPDAAIRLAGGRSLLADRGKNCFRSGANAAISGDMLTTAGVAVQEDLAMMAELGYERCYER